MTLLDRRYLRSDQVWFVSKDEEGRSSLRSLAEYRLRNDAQRICFQWQQRRQAQTIPQRGSAGRR